MTQSSSSQGTSFRNISPVDSFTEDLVWMDMSETAENGTKSIIPKSAHSTPENAVKLVHERKFSTPIKDFKPLEISTNSTETDERDDRKNRTKADNGACRRGATS